MPGTKPLLAILVIGILFSSCSSGTSQTTVLSRVSGATPGSGEVVWRYSTGGWVRSTPVAYKEQLLFGSLAGYFNAVNIGTGEVIWEYKTRGRFSGSPAISGKTAFIGSTDRNLYAFDLEMGEKKWSFLTGGR
ncbi:MAG TPA: PQQ-binding-like beta-propeller repeat protein, partial [Calditrichia bacterium]|nr:PQQ-binding-like beta-propeller repeat protein [Calditrichia bacterium]